MTAAVEFSKSLFAYCILLLLALEFTVLCSGRISANRANLPCGKPLGTVKSSNRKLNRLCTMECVQLPLNSSWDNPLRKRGRNSAGSRERAVE